MFADLHIHTTASDGTATPNEIVKKALNIGLQAIAISDHDTLEGVSQAQVSASSFKLEVLSGVEISTYFNGHEVHLLGYLINPEHDEFVTKLRELQGDRLERIKKVVAKLEELKVFISLERVLELSAGGSIGRPHVAQALVERGYVKTLQEAFSIYIGQNKPAFIPREKLTPIDAIRLVRKARGVPVLAHPGMSKIDNYLPELIDAGLKGLEVWHRKHNSLLTEHYFKLTQKHKLIPTGGSDYHGVQHDTCNVLGSAVAPYESVRLLKEVAGTV